MNKKHIIIFGLMSLLMVLVVFSPAAEPSENQSGFDKYKVISQRNIFSRDRRPARPENDRPEMRPKSVLLSLYILRGTVNNAGNHIAFIEEQVSGESIKAKIGTEVLNGKITDIQFGQVRFEENGQIKTIRIGEEFGKNETTTMVSADEIEEEAPPEEAEKQDAAESSEEDDILKKLLERRKSELSD